MIERDYIMRLIQVLVQALGRIMFLKNKKEYPEALKEIQKSSKSMLGIELDVLRTLSDVQMIDLLSLDAGLGIPKCFAAGMLLKEDAEIASAMHAPGEGRDSLMKSLSLLTESGIRHRGPFDPAHGEAIDSIAERLRGTQIPVHSLKKLFFYYELAHAYDKAAVVLMDVVGMEPSFAKEGSRFYQGLAGRSDAELHAAKLSRAEIESGSRKMAGRS